MKLKCVFLSEEANQKGTYYMILIIWHSREGKTLDTVVKKKKKKRNN